MMGKRAKHYATRNEAIQREIVDVIEAGDVVADAWHTFDVDAIADRVIRDAWDGDGFKVADMSEPEFWTIVAANEVAA